MKETVTREKVQETMAVLAAACLAVYFIFGVKGFAAAALALLLLDLVFRRGSAAVARAWLKFSSVLGRFNTNLLLGLIYFLVLTPLALLFRLFTGRASVLRFDPAARSYFRERGTVYAPADLEKPW